MIEGHGKESSVDFNFLTVDSATFLRIVLEAIIFEVWAQPSVS